jgi:hypothetical protein
VCVGQEAQIIQKKLGDKGVWRNSNSDLVATVLFCLILCAAYGLFFFFSFFLSKAFPKLQFRALGLFSPHNMRIIVACAARDIPCQFEHTLYFTSGSLDMFTAPHDPNVNVVVVLVK